MLLRATFEHLELKLCIIVLVAIIMINHDHTEIQITRGSSNPKQPWATEEAARAWLSK
jgi:hypothetical protein